MEARDPARNQARYYRIEAEYDLFGDFVLTTCYGRIGSPGGQIRRQVFPSMQEAIPTLQRNLRKRMATSRRRSVPYTILDRQDPKGVLTGLDS